ncbi:MAG: MAPEG family protein [Acidimicrobiales bacterium]|nr:MAPEG family protein [Acidimicrobiales bacterium]
MEMTSSLTYLAWTSALCIVLWGPYVLESIMGRGLGNVLRYEDSDVEPARWAQRSHRAHLNLLENLPPFAALVLIANLTEVGVGGAAAVFFWARVAHAIVHIAGVPYLRTAAFFVSWLAMFSMFFQVI